MVAQQPQLQIQTQQPTPSPQDEALKRNTDCVYFLASPLTCKKGNECEYRHSEYARVNPRDCWYWLNGNCLNPKCSFRHPPLDGLLGTPPATTPGGPFVPPPQIATTSAAQAPYNPSKQAVPCIFFQQGLCLKGDRCAFLHGPNPNPGSKGATQGLMTSQGAERPSFKKPFCGIEKHPQERKTPQGGNVARTVGGGEFKPDQKFEPAPQKSMFQLQKHVPPPSEGFDNVASRFKMASSPPLTNGPTVARSNRVHQARLPDDHFHSGKDSDELLRESSPGFDVLVADELRNSDYYHGEDEFGKARGQDERNLDSLNEYDIGHSADYSLAADIDRERFRAPQGYDSYDRMQEPYGWEQHRKTSTHVERRTHRRSGSPDSVEISDLRHRLSKRRKGNGLKSVVAHDHANERHGEEKIHRFPRKDSLHPPVNESSLNNRFRGRIKLPTNGGDGHIERDLDRGRISGRLSSGRSLAPHQGRIQDRIRGRSQEDDERRNFRGRPMERELMGDRRDFSRPKSLAELKNGGRNTDYKEQQFLGKRKSLRDHQQSEDDFPFEGPKPLSEILKEKKGVGASSHSNEEITNSSAHTSVTNGEFSETKEDLKSNLPSNAEESKTGQSPEDGMIYDEAAEDEEYEGDDQIDGEYEYEQGDDGEEYEYEQVEEGENQEQEYMEDGDAEDGDDFAKKIGVVLS